MNADATESNIHPMKSEETEKLSLAPKEGWHVIHLFYHIDRTQWSLLTPEEQVTAKTELTELIHEIRSHENTQLLTFSMLTPKADLGFMLLTADLNDANAFEKRLGQALGPDILAPSFSFLSMTERSEYTTTSEQYGNDTLVGERGLEKDSAEFTEAMEEFDKRMAHYTQDRLYPNMPDWPVFCFYPMNKRRTGTAADGTNWYDLEYEERRQLMMGHAKIGRTWAGKIRQLITGSTGLDDAEWGVTLFAHDTHDVKGIVYEMRFDAVSSRYAEFGDFYIGIQLPLKDLFERVLL